MAQKASSGVGTGRFRAHAATIYRPIQHDYEVIRPIVLFADTAAPQIGVERTVVSDKARHFVTEGMMGLVDGRGKTLPQLELIELDDVQWVKFLRRPSRHYSQRIAMVPQQLSLID